MYQATEIGTVGEVVYIYQIICLGSEPEELRFQMYTLGLHW